MRDFAHMPASLSRTGLHPLDQCVVAQDLRRFRVVDELFLQTIAREPEQHLVETRFPGTAKGVDELRRDASIVDRQFVRFG